MQWLSCRIFNVQVHLISVCLMVIFSILNGEMAAKETNQPPTLLTHPLIPTTPDMLKQGLWGSTTAYADIDSNGLVTSAIIEQSSGNPAFDLLVKHRVETATFRPAIVSGQAVASAVNFEIVVPYDSLLAQSWSLGPNLTGVVIDTMHFIPIPNASVLLHYTDTTQDTSLSIGFDNYLSIIGSFSQQRFQGNVLTTVTDSLGRFEFRLLPTGPFNLSIQALAYETGSFRGTISGTENQHGRFVLQPGRELLADDTYEITVYGQSNLADDRMIIAEQEKRVGFSPFLSNVVLARSEIRHLPEGPSRMMVRSGSPYDNVYLIAGVPMLAPFHFGGHPYADIDGLMISGLTDVRVIVNDIAARRVDASGCIVQTNPGRITYDKHNPEGLYLKGDYSMIGADLLVAYSAVKREEDFVQVGFTKSHDFGIQWTGNTYRSVQRGVYGIGRPASYGNATFAGSKTIGQLYLTGFGWYAWDVYGRYDSNTAEQLPWGMGSIRLGTHTSNRSITYGRAHQFFGSGKIHFDQWHATRSYLSNHELLIDLDTVISGPLTAKLIARVNFDQWNGFASQIDSLHSISTYPSEGKETGFHLNPSFSKQTGRFTTKLNLLTSAISYGHSTQLIADAGTSFSYRGDNFHTGIHLGRVTSRPDIRGIPDSLFRMQLNHTYMASFPFFIRYGVISRLGIQPYIRYSTNAPQLDPVSLMWDPRKSSSLVAYGTDLDLRIALSSRASFTTAINLAQAQRDGASRDTLSYEWHIPWTFRTSLHLNSQDERFHFFANYIRTKGLPYFDVDNLTYQALAVYHSIDLNLQFHAVNLPPQRYVNKLACYLSIKNLQDLFRTNLNVRDYYWDSNNIRHPIFLGNARIDVGARFGIKFCRT